jgi:glycosyltransferase involved in cell wall biosynthesis
MGRAGRERVIERFAWPAIAQETVALYRRLTG